MDRKYIRLSHILNSSTPTYGDRASLEIIPNSEISKGATVNSTQLNFSTNHIGTHIDFPMHYYEDGLSPIDVPIDYWIFNNIALVEIHINPGQLIKADDLIEYELYSDMK
jgi:arylformamidase